MDRVIFCFQKWMKVRTMPCLEGESLQVLNSEIEIDSKLATVRW